MARAWQLTRRKISSRGVAAPDGTVDPGPTVSAGHLVDHWGVVSRKVPGESRFVDYFLPFVEPIACDDYQCASCACQRYPWKATFEQFVELLRTRR
eukprot:9489130-Pyramimonas_sp.AAC.1